MGTFILKFDLKHLKKSLYLSWQVPSGTALRAVQVSELFIVLLSSTAMDMNDMIYTV